MRYAAARRLAVAVVLVLFGTGAFAQGTGPGGGTRGGSPGGGGGWMSAPRAAVAPTPSSPMIQVQLDQLEDDLRLSKEQQPAWNDYAAKVAALMDDVRRAREPARAPAGTATEQLDLVAATARKRIAAIDEIAESGRVLYALLTPEQKAIADRRLARLIAPALGLPGATSPAPVATDAPAGAYGTPVGRGGSGPTGGGPPSGRP
jgi:hypothetical protein